MGLVIGVEFFGFSFLGLDDFLLQIRNSLLHFGAFFLQRVDFVLLG